MPSAQAMTTVRMLAGLQRCHEQRVFRCLQAFKLSRTQKAASISTTRPRSAARSEDPRFRNLANPIEDEFAVLKRHYQKPRYPVVLAHGLLGFDELHLAGALLPGVHYWRGITDALEQTGISVYATSVPPAASIEERAARLREQIVARAGPTEGADKVGGHHVVQPSDPDRPNGVNIIAHSMGGLDARYMISRLGCPVPVRSLTTIATPHRGSAMADFFLHDVLGARNAPRVYRAMRRLGLETGAFGQLTRAYMADEFNPRTPDVPGVRYFSYGAAFAHKPRWWSMFRPSHHVLMKEEGPNDGLVSVESSRWGGDDGYKGTLIDVSHLDLINWTNRMRWLVWQWMGRERKFNALAFYLSICDMLAKEGL